MSLIVDKGLSCVGWGWCDQSSPIRIETLDSISGKQKKSSLFFRIVNSRIDYLKQLILKTSMSVYFFSEFSLQEPKILNNSFWWPRCVWIRTGRLLSVPKSSLLFSMQISRTNYLKQLISKSTLCLNWDLWSGFWPKIQPSFQNSYFQNQQS